MQQEARTPYDTKREAYIELLKPVFIPADPVSHDIVRYFASLLRVLGMEDHGWDPYAESRAMLHDINALFSVDLPETEFKDPALTHFRLGLILYSHVVEMDAPYEVIANLLRFKLGKVLQSEPILRIPDRKRAEGISKARYHHASQD